MSGHARLSPSSRYRWQLCPASVRASTQYERRASESSPAAVDGTHSHTLLEYCIKNGVAGGVRDPGAFIGTILQDHEGKFAVDEERAERVRVAANYINDRITRLGEGTKVVAEQRVDPSQLLGRGDMSGTVDVQIICGDFVELIDYKDGMNPVEVEGNPQLEQYAFGVLAERMAKGILVDIIAMTIIQPKVALKGGEAIKSVALSASELVRTGLTKIINEAAATDDPKAPFVPGDKQCMYCPHRGACNTAVSHQLDKAGIKFENMDLAKEASDKQPGDLTDEQLTELVTSGPLLRKLLDAAEMEALHRITNGHPVSGLKVVKGPGRRGWAFPDEDIAAKLTRMKVPKAMVYTTSVISPAKTDKLQWTDRAGNVCRLTDRQRKVLTTEMISKSEGRMMVVPEADAREAEPFADVAKMFAPPAAEEVPSWLS